MHGERAAGKEGKRARGSYTGAVASSLEVDLLLVVLTYNVVMLSPLRRSASRVSSLSPSLSPKQKS